MVKNKSGWVSRPHPTTSCICRALPRRGLPATSGAAPRHRLPAHLDAVGALDDRVVDEDLRALSSGRGRIRNRTLAVDGQRPTAISPRPEDERERSSSTTRSSRAPTASR